MTWQIIRADARSLPLGDSTVDLIVCSPPYWGLRSYRDDGEHYSGQVGSESTPQQFVDGLVAMIDGEWRRVLKRSGSMFLNLGDKYAGSGGHNNDGISAKSTLAGHGHVGGVAKDGSANKIRATRRNGPDTYPKGLDSARPKSLLGLPWRIALALIDRGWILRAEIVWSKPNGLPESVRDRVRRSHEQVFHFTLEPSYYSAVDRIREPQVRPIPEPIEGHRHQKKGAGGSHIETSLADKTGGINDSLMGSGMVWTNPLGRLPGSVWTIPTQPLIIPDEHKQHYDLPDHFAAFPPELVRRVVLGWSPEDGMVLDPMCGTGTTLGVAHKMGRHGIGVDLSLDYCRLAEWRVGVSNHFDQIDDRTAAEQQMVML